MSHGKPPPPPPEAKRPPPFVPRRSRAPGVPASHRASLLGASARESLNLADAAQRLRDEQVRARVVFYEPEASTNAELDAITQGVIAELHALRNAHPSSQPPPEEGAPRTQRMDDEIQLTAELRHALEFLLDSRRGFLRARVEQLSRRISALFFERALRPELWRDADAPAVPSAEQAIWLAHLATRAAVVAALRAQEVTHPAVTELALARYARVERELQTELLRQRAPELERLLRILTEVFTEFFSSSFRQDLGDLCWSVVRESKVARTEGFLLDGHKVSAAAFKRFREVFEKHFLERLALGVKDPLLSRLAVLPQPLSEDALEFVSDPSLLALVCELMCEAFYDHLQLEGVLDLPVSWKNSVAPAG